MSDPFVIHNGKLLEKSSGEIPILNRAFHYGDGLFETIRVIDGHACFLNIHFTRLLEGLKVLSIETPIEFSLARINNEIKTLIQQNGIERGGRVRVTVYRNSEGNYLPTGNSLSYVIESSTLPNNSFIMNENGFEIDIYSDLKKQISKLSRHKTLNCQLYVLASLYAKEKGLDDVLLLNEKDIIIETTNANIFIASNKVLYTPPLEDGCVGGTMRMQVINTALKHDFKVYETTLRPQNLLVADELFLSNSIFGLRWVDNYRQKRYKHDLSDFLLEKLNAEARQNS